MNVVVDKVIASAVARWRRMKSNDRFTDDAFLMLSEACRGLASPNLCSALLQDIMKENKHFVLDHQESAIAERLSATYSRLRWYFEAEAFYRDVFFGPLDENGISAFKWHLGL